MSLDVSTATSRSIGTSYGPCERVLITMCEEFLAKPTTRESRKFLSSTHTDGRSQIYFENEGGKIYTTASRNWSPTRFGFSALIEIIKLFWLLFTATNSVSVTCFTELIYPPTSSTVPSLAVVRLIYSADIYPLTIVENNSTCRVLRLLATGVSRW